MRIRIGYPSLDRELEILQNPEFSERKVALKSISSPERMLKFQTVAKQVHVDQAIAQYILAIADRTRKHNDIELGISTRGTLLMHRACQARALIHGRGFCTPDDVKALVKPVIGHRPDGARQLPRWP